MNSLQLLLFVLATASAGFYFRKQLQNPACHGFYRFFVFDGILFLTIQNALVWTKNMFAPLQLLSWALLFVSLALILHSLYLFKSRGAQDQRQDTPENFNFENTTALITGGILKYIRHPMYSSLLLLAWGVFFKQITLLGMAVVTLSTLFLIITAKIEERENQKFFGEDYRHYQKNSKMFVPFVL